MLSHSSSRRPQHDVGRRAALRPESACSRPGGWTSCCPLALLGVLGARRAARLTSSGVAGWLAQQPDSLSAQQARSSRHRIRSRLQLLAACTRWFGRRAAPTCPVAAAQPRRRHPLLRHLRWQMMTPPAPPASTPAMVSPPLTAPWRCHRSGAADPLSLSWLPLGPCSNLIPFPMLLQMSSRCCRRG